VAAPELAELDVNPFIVLPAGQGALAADALLMLTLPRLTPDRSVEI
jgi:hypothetical protein